MADAGGNDRDNGGTSDLEAFRGRIFLLFEKGYAFRWYEVAMKACIVVAILLSLCTIVAETVDTGNNEVRDRVLRAIELVVVSIFSFELLVRLWSCTADPDLATLSVFGCTLYTPRRALEVHPVWGRIAFLLSPLTLADIAALVPAILLLFSSSVPSVFFLLRVFRLIRFYRHSHLLQSVLELSRVVHDQRDMLVATLFLNASILLVLGAIMYYVEGLWYSVATLTTVGYGDITPTTWLGKMVGGAAAILAVGMFGLPAGILSDGFKELAEKRRSKMRTMGKVLERFKTGQSKRLTLRHWFKLSARRSRVGLALAPCVAPSPPNAPAGAALLDRAKRTWSLKSDGHSEEVVLRSSSGDEGAGGAHSAPDGKYILPSRLKHRIHVETGESDLPQPLQRGRPSTRAEQVKLEDSAAALPEAPVSGPSLLCPHCEHIIPLVVLPQAHSGTLAEQNVPREATRLQQYQLSASSRLPFGVTAQELGQPQRPDSPLDKE